MIEWRSVATGGKISKVDAATMTVTTDFGVEKGDVINIIPPQQAGKIAVDAGLTDASGWCPVNPITFESTIHPGIHVIGDACIARPCLNRFCRKQPGEGGCCFNNKALPGEGPRLRLHWSIPVTALSGRVTAFRLPGLQADFCRNCRDSGFRRSDPYGCR